MQVPILGGTPDVQPARFTGFVDGEQHLLRAGLDAVMENILGAAREGSIPVDEREAAAASLLITASLMFEIDDLHGVEHPPLDVFRVSAELVASGTYGEALATALGERGDEAHDPEAGFVGPLGVTLMAGDVGL